MKRFFLSITVLLLCSLVLTPERSTAEFYKWIDDNGTVHFADSPAGIPAKYRKNVEKNEVEVSSKPQVNDGVTSDKNRALNKKISDLMSLQKSALKKHNVNFSPQSGKVPGKRILVDVLFNGTVKAPMIIDTGSPQMLISPKLAEQLGLFKTGNSRLKITAGGIGGQVPATLTIIESVSIGSVEDVFVPTIIVDSISNDFEGLIGMDLIEKYSMTVDYNKKVVTFEEQPFTEKAVGGHTQGWWERNFTRFRTMRGELRSLKDRFKEILFRSETVQGLTRKDLEEALKEIDLMANDADSLFQKLDLYASRNAVPTHWRK